jgi:hypothetical protein
MVQHTGTNVKVRQKHQDVVARSSVGDAVRHGGAGRRVP